MEIEDVMRYRKVTMEEILLQHVTRVIYDEKDKECGKKRRNSTDLHALHDRWKNDKGNPERLLSI